MSLPKFHVIVCVRKTENFGSLCDELVGLAGEEPDEPSDDQGMVSFQWALESHAKAESIAAALLRLCERPEIALLRLSNSDDPQASFSFKDTRNRQ